MPKLGLGLSLPQTRITGSAPLIPTDGLSLWLKADAGVTLSGSNVTAWADQSGNGNNATSPDTYPTFVSSSINSKPAISFNDDGSWMQIPQNNIGNEGNISIFVVLNYSAGAILLNKGDAATFNATVWEITTSNGFGFVDNIDLEEPSWNTVPISIPQDEPVLLEAFSSAGVSQIAYNGTNSGSPSPANNNFNPISQYIGIGGGGTDGGSTTYLDARIAEIIIYNRQVTNPERQEVEAYLMSKYAITAPSGIPISTAIITVLTVGGTSAALVGAYNKQSDTEWWGGGDYYLRYDGIWYFQNDDTGAISYHPTGTNPNFIPDTGWDDGITITAA